MSRVLFVVPPMVGHTNPTVSIAAALAETGHEAAWVGHGAVLDGLLPDGALLHSLDSELSGDQMREAAERARRLRGLAGLKFLWEEVLIPLARSMVPGVRAALDRLRPDVLCVDQQALAGALAARSAGLPWATLATTSADRKASLGDLPKVLEWTEERLADLQRELGMEPVTEPEASPYAVIVLSTAALVGDTDRYPPSYHFVGPAFAHRPTNVDFPWAELGSGRRVLVSLGTLNAERGGRFFAAVAAALGALPLEVVMVAPATLGPFPANFIVRPFVPQVELLERVDAVVCHGGHNTVCEALARGLPLVIAPIKDDQPVIAKQVTDAGCGLRLSFTRPRPAHIAEAVRRVLDEPSFAAAARRVQASFAAAGGAPRAAELLVGLAAGARPPDARPALQ